MGTRLSQIPFFKKIKQRLHSRVEQLFPAPVEARLIQVLGGTTLTLGFIRQRKTGRQMTLIVSRGRLLRSERFRRAALTGDGILANDIKWAIAVQGSAYERDVVAAYERDQALKDAGWRVAYIRAKDLWSNPSHVRQNVLHFLT